MQGLDPSGNPLWRRHRAIYMATEEHTPTYVSHMPLQACSLSFRHLAKSV